MKKLFITTLLLPVLTLPSLAQNTTPWPSNGNVGIGTLNPSSLLHLLQSSNSSNLIITDLAAAVPNNFAGLSIRVNNLEYMGLKGNPYTGELRLGGFNAENYYTTIYSNNQESARITNGKLGIGTSNPFSRLHVFGGDIFLGTDTYSGQNDAGRKFRLYQNDDYSPSILLGASYSASVGETTFSRIRTQGARLGALVFEIGAGSIFAGSGDPTSFSEAMRIASNGNVLVGKSTQANTLYKLDVEGSIRANEIKVNSNGADFVFEDDYKLRSLAETESFIKANRHLPEIAPAESMKKEGIDLGEMNIKLLQKIEELTLYMIDLKKENDQIKLILKKMDPKPNKL